MSADSAHLSTFGADTETEAEIRSTSNPDGTSKHCTTAVCSKSVYAWLDPVK